MAERIGTSWYKRIEHHVLGRGGGGTTITTRLEGREGGARGRQIGSHDGQRDGRRRGYRLARLLRRGCSSCWYPIVRSRWEWIGLARRRVGREQRPARSKSRSGHSRCASDGGGSCRRCRSRGRRLVEYAQRVPKELRKLLVLGRLRAAHQTNKEYEYQNLSGCSCRRQEGTNVRAIKRVCGGLHGGPTRRERRVRLLARRRCGSGR